MFWKASTALLTYARILAVVAVSVAASPASPASAIETDGRHALLVDFDTGAVLLEKDADQLMPPASMSKMMTIYMVFERLKQGKLKLDDTFVVSEDAWRRGGAATGGSTMFLKLGSTVTVEDLIRGIVVQSGNDACIVVAEGIAGSEEAFARLMTERGREMGMLNTTFRNSTGWPDPEHLTTAEDLALLAKRTIIDFPEYYPYYSEVSFTYNGIRQGNRNPVLYQDPKGDGLKTGHTQASGYGLTASAKAGDRRLIMVFNGLPSIKARTAEATKLLSWGFRQFDNYKLFAAGETVADAEVWLGSEEAVPLLTQQDLVVTLPRHARKDMKVTVSYDGPLPAPIQQGDPVAVITVTAPDMAPLEVPLVAGNAVEQRGFFGRLVAVATYMVLGQVK